MGSTSAGAAPRDWHRRRWSSKLPTAPNAKQRGCGSRRDTHAPEALNPVPADSTSLSSAVLDFEPLSSSTGLSELAIPQVFNATSCPSRGPRGSQPAQQIMNRTIAIAIDPLIRDLHWPRPPALPCLTTPLQPTSFSAQLLPLIHVCSSSSDAVACPPPRQRPDDVTVQYSSTAGSMASWQLSCIDPGTA